MAEKCRFFFCWKDVLLYSKGSSFGEFVFLPTTPAKFFPRNLRDMNFGPKFFPRNLRVKVPRIKVLHFLSNPDHLKFFPRNIRVKQLFPQFRNSGPGVSNLETVPRSFFPEI